MSQQHSRRAQFEINPEIAIIAMGNHSPVMFDREPWRNPSVPRLQAVSSSRLHLLPSEYKVDISQ